MTQKTKAEAKPPVPMEIIQAMMEQNSTLIDLDLVMMGHKVSIRYREMSWLEKSRVLSLALEYIANANKKGETELTVKLHHDVYRREALRVMVVETPIPFTDKLLEALPSSVGEQLEKIIPTPFSSEQADAIKKE